MKPMYFLDALSVHQPNPLGPFRPTPWPPGTLLAYPLTPGTLSACPLTPGTLSANWLFQSRTFYCNIFLSECICLRRPTAIGDPSMLEAKFWAEQSSPLHMPTMPRAAPCTSRRSCKTIAPSMQHATCNVTPPWQDNLPWQEEDTKMWKSERRWWKCWNGYVSVETAGPLLFCDATSTFCETHQLLPHKGRRWGGGSGTFCNRFYTTNTILYSRVSESIVNLKWAKWMSVLLPPTPPTSQFYPVTPENAMIISDFCNASAVNACSQFRMH